MTDIKTLLHSFKAKGAKFYKPASASQVDFANALLKNNSYPEIPLEYAKFLELSDGMSGSMIEFFGVVNKTRDSNYYALSTVPSAMQDFLGTAKSPGFLILGSFPLGYVSYSKTLSRYQLLDITSMRELAAAKTFREVLFALKDYV
ncbi:MAG: hypothetical protein FWD15_02125 [Alphaproteobacteria bacterium]|nr:hypothetical protein [Alphaproteobacteria bacterium]